MIVLAWSIRTRVASWRAMPTRFVASQHLTLWRKFYKKVPTGALGPLCARYPGPRTEFPSHHITSTVLLH
eukprot:jgi/Mesvir1/8405/Mv25354-RA.1